MLVVPENITIFCIFVLTCIFTGAINMMYLCTKARGRQGWVQDMVDINR